jgi:hypothetical protein
MSQTGLGQKSGPTEESAYFTLAFLVPFLIRMIPELIAWPYPLGFDTLGYYVPAMRWWINPFSGRSLPNDALGIVQSAGLFYVISAAFNRFVITDPLVAVKILGPLLTGFVSLSVFAYARLALRWNLWKALLASLIATLYFVGLRISWEMYHNMLGVAFLFAAILALDALKGPRRCVIVTVLTLLTFMSHEIAGVILLGVFVLETLRLYARRRFEQVTSQIYFSALASGLFLFQLSGFLDQTGRFAQLNTVIFGPPVSWEVAVYVLGFPVYCFIFLLPLALLGLGLRKRRSMNWWSVTCLLILAPVFSFGLRSVPEWFRWQLMLVYPLSFYFAEGFEKAIRFRPRRYASGLTMKATAVGLIALIAFTSCCYLVASPENAFPYFSQYNPYLRYIQSSMVQSSIPIQDVPSVLRAIDLASSLLNDRTVLVLHEAVFVWAVNRLGTTAGLVPVKEEYLSANPESASKSLEQVASAQYDSGHLVYTIWWSGRSNWYTISELPATFRLIESTGAFAIYAFTAG